MLVSRHLSRLYTFDRINKNNMKLAFGWDDNLGLTSLHLNIYHSVLEK